MFNLSSLFTTFKLRRLPAGLEVLIIECRACPGTMQEIGCQWRNRLVGYEQQSITPRLGPRPPVLYSVLSKHFKGRARAQARMAGQRYGAQVHIALSPMQPQSRSDVALGGEGSWQARMSHYGPVTEGHSIQPNHPRADLRLAMRNSESATVGWWMRAGLREIR